MKCEDSKLPNILTNHTSFRTSNRALLPTPDPRSGIPRTRSSSNLMSLEKNSRCQTEAVHSRGLIASHPVGAHRKISLLLRSSSRSYCHPPWHWAVGKNIRVTIARRTDLGHADKLVTLLPRESSQRIVRLHDESRSRMRREFTGSTRDDSDRVWLGSLCHCWFVYRWEWRIVLIRGQCRDLDIYNFRNS